MKYLNTKPGSIEEIAAKMQSSIKEDEYQKLFKRELDKAGKGIGSMSPQEKKDFFNKIDKMYKGKNEAKVDELTAGQKKLPPALQKAIKDKEDKKESVEEAEVPKGHHKMPDGSIMKNGTHKKETHMSTTKAMNKSQKDAKGETEIVKSEDLDNKDKPTVKDVISQLKKATKAHSGQAKDLEKAMKNEADDHGNEINKGKLDMVKKGEKKPVDPEPKMKFKSFKEAMDTVGDSDAQKANNQPMMKKSGKDKDIKTIKGSTAAGTKPTPVDTTPEVDYKN